jgi:hypothetical protein
MMPLILITVAAVSALWATVAYVAWLVDCSDKGSK